MTCNGCRSHVEEVLNNMDGVESATVDLDNETATIEMNHPINSLLNFGIILLDWP